MKRLGWIALVLCLLGGSAAAMGKWNKWNGHGGNNPAASCSPTLDYSVNCDSQNLAFTGVPG